MFAIEKTNWFTTAYDFQVHEFKIVDAVGGNFIFSIAFHHSFISKLITPKKLSDNFEGSLILKIDFKL